MILRFPKHNGGPLQRGRISEELGDAEVNKAVSPPGKPHRKSNNERNYERLKNLAEHGSADATEIYAKKLYDLEIAFYGSREAIPTEDREFLDRMLQEAARMRWSKK